MGDHGMGMAMALFMEGICVDTYVCVCAFAVIEDDFQGNSKKIFWILFWIQNRDTIMLFFHHYRNRSGGFPCRICGSVPCDSHFDKKGYRITKGSERSGTPSILEPVRRIKRERHGLQGQ